MIICFLLVVLGAVACERLGWLKRRPWAIGAFFGVLAVAAHPLAFSRCGWCVPARDAPVLVAALCFGARAGLAAGLTAGVGAFFMMPPADLAASPLCPLGTLGTALYALAVSRGFFSSRRPTPVAAGVIAAFGEAVHLAIDSFGGAQALSRVVDTACQSFAAESAMLAAVVVAAALARGGWRTLRAGLRSLETTGTLAFAAGFGLFAWIQATVAARQLDALAQDGRERLEHSLDDQIGYMLHCDADALVSYLGSAKELPYEDMRKLARICDLDEANVVDSSGRVLASTDAGTLKDPLIFSRHPATRECLALTNGATGFVKQRFRPSVSDPDVTAKYIGVPFEDGSGFVQLGYYWKRFERDFQRFFFPMLVDLSIARTGCYLVVNGRDGTVAADALGHPGLVGRPLSELGLGLSGIPSDGRSRFDARLFGAGARCSQYRIGQWIVLCAVPMSDVCLPAFRLTFFVAVLLIAFLALTRLLFLRFKEAHDKIDELRRREDEHRRKDMTQARTIQRSALPTEFPDADGFRLRATMTAAKEVGGDFYDFFRLPDGRLCALIADVSGKGVPGALFMMQAKLQLRTSIGAGGDLGEAVAAANAALCSRNEAEMFVTLWVGVYDGSSGALRFVNAGHNPPAVRHADGALEWVRARSGLPLATIDTAPYRTRELALAPGDALFLYTDGVTEAVDVAGELYGEGRLERALASADGDFIAAVSRDLDGFVGTAEQADDITMLVLERKPKAASGRSA